MGNGDGTGVGEVTDLGQDLDRRELADAWAEALARAAHNLRANMEPGLCTVVTQVYVKTNSPGFIDGFRVSLV
jgi:hypothetical protein